MIKNAEQQHICDEYHKLYYNSGVWSQQSWGGAQCMKSVFDVFNYQEIIFDIQPNLIVEIGTYKGGSTLMFYNFLKNQNLNGILLTVDISHELSKPFIDNIPDLYMIEGDSISKEVISQLKWYIGNSKRTFMILDGEHKAGHVLQEMILLGNLLKKDDYLIVEDSNVNGHPVYPGFGPGPYEAIQEYFKLYPNNFKHDYEREHKFGVTFAPEGYLIKL